jgi:Class II flagellar assembly regulator
MRVDQKLPLSSPASPATQRRGPAGQRFTLGESGSSSAATGASAAPLATVDALLALQGEDDAAKKKSRSVQRGNELLDALDRLKAALLSGRVSTADLQAIAARLAERRELSGDPRLDELISHIELRARVEMAKLGIR